MGLVPKPSLLVLRKSRNNSAALAETNGSLISSMPVSGIQSNELVISSKKLEGIETLNHGVDNMHLVFKNKIFDSLPLKYAGTLRNSREGIKSVTVYSLLDKFKRLNKDLDGEYRKEQWVPMSGTPSGTSFSDLCKAGKLSVNFNRNYAACIPKHSGRSQRSAKLTVGFNGNQADLCFQDVRGVPGYLCIGVEDATYCGTDFDRDGETSVDPLVPENMFELEIPLEHHTPLSENNKQSRDAAKTGNERGLTILSKLELHCQKLPPSSEIISSSSDTPLIQSTKDLSVTMNKSEQHSPVSVLEPLFEDASLRPADDASATMPEKPPLRPHRINFEERSPVKRVKVHSDTTSKTHIPSKKHTSSSLEYTRKVLEVSELNWYQLALKWHCSTQMLDPATYIKMKSQSTSQILTPLETRLLFDHINEVLLDTYQPYDGFYPWVPLSRPNKQHLLTERNFFDDIIKIVEMNLIPRQHQVPEQKLIIDSMEKCGKWMDIRKDLEDMVLEIADEVAEELVEEFMFEMWID